MCLHSQHIMNTIGNESPSSQISEQNISYRESLLDDIQIKNKTIKDLMDFTLDYQYEQAEEQLIQYRNNLTREQKARLMTGESLEQILQLRIKPESKYYNTSDIAAQSIPENNRFEYKIGEHLLIYELNELNINAELKTIDITVVVYDTSEGWKEVYYTIIDENVFIAVNQQLIALSKYAATPFNGPTNPTRQPTISKIQDNIFEQLLAMFQAETIYTQLVYNEDIELKISQLLNEGSHPTQITNNIIEYLLDSIDSQYQ